MCFLWKPHISLSIPTITAVLNDISLLKCILGILNRFFSIDKVVPVHVWPVFLADTFTRLFIREHFYGSHAFPCPFLLLSTTVLNDYNYIMKDLMT